MYEIIYKILGIIGLLLITTGILLHKRKLQDILFIIGGISLGIYSYSIKDTIFLTLQIIFIIAAVYDYFKVR